MRLSGFRACRLLSASYVEVNRNIPVVVKLFFFYFVFGIPPIVAALLGLIIHQSAYIAEDVRAAIQSIPRGQSEAARASGLTSWLLIRQIIMPQAIKIALPTLVIEMIELLKNSSIAMVITVEELTFASQQIESITFRRIRDGDLCDADLFRAGVAYCESGTALSFAFHHRGAWWYGVGRWQQNSFGQKRVSSGLGPARSIPFAPTQWFWVLWWPLPLPFAVHVLESLQITSGI